MDFDLTEEQRLFRDAIRNFAETEVAPLVDEAEEKEETPLQLFPRMGELGYLCIRYSEKYGAAGADKLTECIEIEELNRICAGIAGAVTTTHGGLGTYAIYEYGTEEQKQKFIVPAIRGEKKAAFALTEPNAGSDAIALQTRAVREGDHYVINGTKTFISNGPFCDFVVVAAYTSDPKTVKRGKGISLIVVERGTPGFSSTKIHKVGHRSHETGELVFDDCRVPVDNLIGQEGEGLTQILATLRSGRLSYGARATGIAQAAYEAAFRYAQERVQFGRPIAKFQVNTFKLVDMAIAVDIMRIMTYRAAWLFDQGRDCMKEACMVKLFATEALQKVVNDAMQIHGGYGYTMEYPVQRYWRDARLLTITEGTSEIQHLAIARELGI